MRTVAEVLDGVKQAWDALQAAEVQAKQAEEMAGQATNGPPFMLSFLKQQQEEIARRRQRAKNQYRKARLEATELIETMPDMVGRAIFIERYIYFQPWKEIEARYDISHRTAMRRRVEGLRILEKEGKWIK